MDHVPGGQKNLLKHGSHMECVTISISGDVEKMRGLASTLTTMEIME